MAYRNTARIHPGEKDMGVMGNPGKFSMLAAENEEASPWEPYHVTHGFDEDDSTITFSAPNGWLQWIPESNTAEQILRGMIKNTPNSMGAQSDEDLNRTIFHAFNPYNAEEVEKSGLQKREMKEYLVNNSYIEASSSEGLSASREEGPVVEPFQERQYANTEAVKIATIGGPGRWNVIIGTSIGGPVTKKIEFPSGWDGLVEEYSANLEWYENARY